MGVFAGNTSSWSKLEKNKNYFASGGTITEVEANGFVYRVHTFTSVGNSTLTVNKVLNEVEYLIVAGGGGGGQGGGGGGGAGGLLYNSNQIISPSSYTISVGGGGGSPGQGNNYTASNGSNSSIAGIATAIGGGRGGKGESGDSTTSAGGNGGSGGGAGLFAISSFGLGQSGQGNNGGRAVAQASPAGYAGGGGGGAGGVGSNATTSGNQWGSAGVGLTYSITGQDIIYATGGNGNRNVYGTTHPTTTSNRGNGGHAGSFPVHDGRPGGSGIVIIRYPIGVIGQ